MRKRVGGLCVFSSASGRSIVAMCMRRSQHKRKHLVIPGFFDHGNDGVERTLPDIDSAHLLQSLRLRMDDCVSIADGAGRRCVATVTGIENRHVVVTIQENSEIYSPRKEYIDLYLALAKPKAFQVAIQKATELGVRRIFPILSERCNEKDGVKLTQEASKEYRAKSARWREICRQAARQSENSWLPEVMVPQLFPSALSNCQIEASDATSTREYIVAHPSGVDWTDYISQPTDRIDAGTGEIRAQLVSAVWIGPEGGFSDMEIDSMKEKRFANVRIHYNVLRVETAVVVAITLLSLRNRVLFDRDEAVVKK